MLKQPKAKNVPKKKKKITEITIEDDLPEAPKLSDFEIIRQIEIASKKDCEFQKSDENLSDQNENDCAIHKEEKNNTYHGTESGLVENNSIIEILESCNFLENEPAIDNSAKDLNCYSELSKIVKIFSHELQEASAPIDKKFENVESVMSLNNLNESQECLDIYKYKFSVVLEDNIIPFTDEKLFEYYFNFELETVKNSIGKKINREVINPSKKDNYLYRLLVEYIQSKNFLCSHKSKIKELRNRINVCASALWTVQDDIRTGDKMCKDGNNVSFIEKFTLAQFNKNTYDEFVYLLKEIKCTTYENFLRESFICSFLKLKIEHYLQSLLVSCPEFTNLESEPITISAINRNSYFEECLQQLKQAIDVLFSLQRKEHIDVDEDLLFDSREWLSSLVSVLLRVGTWKDQIYLLSHILRCPGGVGEWAASFIQMPLPEILTDPFNSDHINHILTILHVFLSPIDQNENLNNKTDAESANDSNPWTVVDSDGEIEGDTNQKLFLLKERDLVSILKQVPFGYLFKEIFHYKNVEISSAQVTSHYLLKLFSFSTDFIKILLNGLKSYSMKKYKQFNKRLGQLICHIVHYVTDALKTFKSHIRDEETDCRIQVEYDNFFLRSIKYIFSAKKHGPWQFLATMPYDIVSQKAILKIYALLQLNEAQEDNILAVNFANFEDKFMLLPEEEQYYLLTTFANMALARDISEIEFIRNVFLQLFYIGFASSQTMDNSYKNVRYLLCSICSRHPFLISEILTVQNSMFALKPTYDERLSICLWLKLPLDMWRPSETDLEIISKWLFEPLNSLRNELARIILQSLNYGIVDGELFLPPITHQAVATTLMQASLKLINENDQGFMKNVSNLVYSQSAEQTVCEWIWSILMKLRLHLLDKTEACLYKNLCNLEKHLNSIPDVDLNAELHNLVLKKYPIACFIALMTTTLGHSVPLMYDKGFELVEILLKDGKYNPGIASLEFMTFLFLDCSDSLYKCEKFVSLLSQLIGADNTYVQKAKSFISNNFPGPVLKSVECMIQQQLNCCRALGFNKFNDCIKLWMMSLTRLPLWNQEVGVLFLMNNLLQNSFFNYTSSQMVTATLENILKESKSPSETKSSISSLIGWVNSKISVPSLLPKGSNGDVPWLSYAVTQIEFEDSERKNYLWMELLKELHASRDKKADIDGSLKKVCHLLGYTVRPSSSLAIYKWSNLILNTDIEHSLVPLMWQKFFSLYLNRSFGPAEYGSMGEKFFDGVLNQRLFKQLNQRLTEAISRYNELSSQGEGKKEGSHHWKCHKLFRTFSLWLNDPKLHEPHLNIHHLSPEYNPELLGLLIHGSETPWIDFIEYECIEKSFCQLSQCWAELKNRLKHEKMNHSNSFKTEKSQEDILLDRINSYEAPLPPPPLTNISKKVLSKLNPKDLSNSDKAIEFMKPHIDKLMAYRDQFTFVINQNLSLSFDLQELSTKLYCKATTRKILKQYCSGMNHTLGGKSVQCSCSGPAILDMEYEEWQRNEKIQKQFDRCLEAFDENIQKNLSDPPMYLSVAAVCLDAAIEELKKEYDLATKLDAQSGFANNLRKIGVNLFYEFVRNWSESVIQIPPLERAFDRYLNLLGKTFLEGNDEESDKLLRKILENDIIEDRLLRYFTPNTFSIPQDFIKLFSTALECESSEKLLTVLSKFDVIRFLHENEPKFSIRSALIACVERGLISPKQKNLDLQKMLNEYLGILLKYDFPEHYGEILNFLLDASRNHAIPTSTWYVFLNSLILDTSFLLESGNPIRKLKQYFIKFASDEGISLDLIRDTLRVLASNFNNERFKAGHSGLHGKYSDYVEPLFIFFGMLSYGCVTKTLELDIGSLSEKLIQRLWPLLSDLYAPWLVPYCDQKDNSATIDQGKKPDGSLDPGIKWPWTLNDVSSANFCASVFADSIRFILDTLPGFNNVLSYVWYFYASNYAQVHVKEFVLSVMHETLAFLPWENFFPNLKDVELMVQTVNQYLPSSHCFLGNIFVNVKWTEVVQYSMSLRDDDFATKMHICLLHLMVKLPLEPSLKQNDKVLTLLDEAENYSWHLIDACNYEIVLNWFVTSCDPRIILMDERLDYYKLDSAIFRLLKTCAGYTTTAKQYHPSFLTKRSLFVKACVKWLISSNKRFKSKDLPLFKKALQRMWDDMDYIITRTASSSFRIDETVILLGEFLPMFSEPGLSSVVEDALCDWLTQRQSEIVIFALLKSAGSAVETSDQYGKIVESSLESYFSFLGESNWAEVTRILAPFAKSNALLDKVLIDNKYYLTLYASLLKKTNLKGQRSLSKMVLTDLLHILSEEKLSASLEPKLLLIMRFCLTMIQSDISVSEKDGLVSLVRLLTVLSGFVEDKESGFLSAVGLRRPTFSNRYKLMCLSVCSGITVYINKHHPEWSKKICEYKYPQILNEADTNKVYQGIGQYVSHAKTAVEDIKTINDIVQLINNFGFKLFNKLYLK